MLEAVDSFLGKFEKAATAIEFFTGISIPTSIGTNIGITSNLAADLRNLIPHVGPDLRNLLGLTSAGPQTTLAPPPGILPPPSVAGGGGAAAAAEKLLTIADALTDGIIDLSEAMELGLSVTDAAILELAAAETAQAAAAFRANVEFEKLKRTLGPLGLLGQIDVFAFALTDLGQEFRNAGETVVQFIKRLADAAKDALQSAFSDLFSRPTKEQATLELELAKLQRQRGLLFLGGRTADELEPILTPLDLQIKAIEDLLSVRREEQNIQQSLFDLADQTLLTDQQQLVQLNFIREALEEFTSSLVQQNVARAVPQAARNADAGSLNIEVHMSGIGMSIEQIGAELSRKAQTQLRRSGFGGSQIGSGTFVPG